MDMIKIKKEEFLQKNHISRCDFLANKIEELIKKDSKKLLKDFRLKLIWNNHKENGFSFNFMLEDTQERDIDWYKKSDFGIYLEQLSLIFSQLGICRFNFFNKKFKPNSFTSIPLRKGIKHSILDLLINPDFILLEDKVNKKIFTNHSKYKIYII